MDVSNRKMQMPSAEKMGYISILLILACGNVPLPFQRSVSASIPVALVTIVITKGVWHVPRVDFQTLLGLLHPKFAEVVQLERFPSRVQWNVHFVNRESIPRSRHLRIAPCVLLANIYRRQGLIARQNAFPAIKGGSQPRLEHRQMKLVKYAHTAATCHL